MTAARPCAWCYRPAVWLAHTPRHDAGVPLCQGHYDDTLAAMRADRLARLTGAGLDLVRAAWGRP